MDGQLPFDDLRPTPTSESPVYTVSALTARIKALIEHGLGAVAVEGEISNCRPASSGHLYFTLKDQAAQLRAVMFRTTARLLKFAPEDGLRVIARGRISVYSAKGEYQLVCDAIEPHGLGARQLAFEQLKRRLEAEGLFESSRKRALPTLPRRIGIVTSLDGAAIRDILRILTTRYPAARVVIRPARVQGDEAAQDLVRALHAVAKVPDIDVIIIGRGGGSVEDLWAFNNERLARAIAACPVPVISAVGHEVDFTIADFVADIRAATPSNAAELVVDRADNFYARIERATGRLTLTMRSAIGRRADLASRCALRLRQWPTAIVLRDRDCDEWRLRLDHAVADRMARLRERTGGLDRRLVRRDVRQIAAEWRARLVGAEGRLVQSARHRRASWDLRVREAAARLHALSPLAVLGRGYAVCWNEPRTSIIRSARAVSPGERVRVTLAEGELACRVEPETPS